MSEQRLRRKKTLTGVVTGDKMDKTVIVSVARQFQQPRYKKYIRMLKKYKAHDEANACSVGDLVIITESRPLSKDKHWRVSKILEKMA
ncbi:MAG: 30S ribosomal protein S17 [Deltaproteobacteria bacterium]|nr:30S ribosomal protein S17 [Deltaproteobacteria bacterium]